MTTLYCDYYERGFPFIYFFFMATAEERGFTVASIERGKSFKKNSWPFSFFFFCFCFSLILLPAHFSRSRCCFYLRRKRVRLFLFVFFWISKWDYYDRLPDGWTASATRFPSHFLNLKLFVVPRRVMNKHHGIVLHVDGGDMVLVCTDLPFVFSPPLAPVHLNRISVLMYAVRSLWRSRKKQRSMLNLPQSLNVHRFLLFFQLPSNFCFCFWGLGIIYRFPKTRLIFRVYWFLIAFSRDLTIEKRTNRKKKGKKKKSCLLCVCRRAKRDRL